mgnify:CR=1 FL=1
MTDYILNGVLGLAVGNALGSRRREKHAKSEVQPVLEMRQVCGRTIPV